MSEKKEDLVYVPTEGYPYFYHDPEGDGFVYFKSESERDEHVKDAIQGYLDDGWAEEVENVTVGKLTGVATKVNVIERPNDGSLDDDNCDEDGRYWDSDWDYICNYEIKPLGYVCPTNK